jgi:hypothetical protein
MYLPPTGLLLTLLRWPMVLDAFPSFPKSIDNELTKTSVSA